MSTVQYRVGWEYVWPDIYSYFLRPMVFSCQFPFFTAPFDLGASAFPSGFKIPPGYNTDEPVAGALGAAPWNFFVAVAGVFAARGARRLWRRRPQAAALTARERSAVWVPAAFATLGTATGLAMIAMFLATQRYFVDISAGLLLLATWGAFSLYTAVRDRPWPRRIVTLVIVGAAAATIVIGLLLGVTGYNEMFKLHNPSLLRWMVRTFSLC
jgi:succinate dehydrogenase/fumarate reductase cytochrome b subunit